MSRKIVAFPSRKIAYNDALYSEFRAQGVQVINGEWSGRWLLTNISHGDIVHFHWPSFLYNPHDSVLNIIISFLRYLVLMTIVRLRSREVWWTAHNLMPHERCRIPQIDVAARIVIIRFARRIFVHGVEAEKVLVRRFPAAARKTKIIPHGNWIGFYPPCPSKIRARADLNICKDSFVYLLFGQCKPYKNLEGLIEAFKHIGTKDEVLLIAGGFSDKGYLAKVSDVAQEDPRIRIDAGFVPNEAVSKYLLACDAMCIPYKEILTSGTAMLALSYGRPVLSINRGFLRETVGNDCGILIDSNDQGEIERALINIKNIRWNEGDIVAIAQKYTFHEAVELSLSCL